MDDYLNQSRKISFSFNDVAQFLILILISKFLKSFGIYLCYDLLKQIHLVQLLFFSLSVASLFFILLQKPFSYSVTTIQQQQAKSSSNLPVNKKLNKFQYLRLFKYSLFQTFIKLLWLFGLTQCGPLRTTLIFEQSEFVVLCALKAIFLSQTNPSRSRGVLVLLTATLILLVFDNDHSMHRVVYFIF
jgi:zinc transporter 5/7